MDLARTMAGAGPARTADQKDAFTPALIEQWAVQIHAGWSLGTNGVFELARLVREAHDALRPYRAWSWLCKSDKLPFKKTKAKYLLFVGKRVVGTVNGRTFGYLPHEITVLYELAHLEPSEITRCVDELLIRPDMKRAEAKALVARLRGRPKATARKRSLLLARLDRVVESLRDETLPPKKETLRRAEIKAGKILKLIQRSLDSSASSQPDRDL